MDVQPWLKQTVHWAAKTSQDGWGESTYGPTVPVKARYEEKHELVRDRQGNEVVSDAQFVCLEEIVSEDKIWPPESTPTVSNSGTAQAGTSTSITLAAGASATNDAYKDMTVRTIAGTGPNQYRLITAYNGTTKVATVAAWTVIPDNTTTYEVRSDAEAAARQPKQIARAPDRRGNEVFRQVWM